MNVPLRRDELDFLPAALRVVRQPAHPLPRALAMLLVCLVVAALAWVSLGEVDVVAQAPGRLVAHDRSKTIQALERGLVRQILVRDGDRVRAGQDLVLLDATTPEADEAIHRAQWQQADDDLRRARWLLAALAGEQPERAMPAGAPRSGRSTGPVSGTDGDADTAAEWQHVTARRARLDAEHARRQAELATASEAVRKAEALLPLARQREGDLIALTHQGFVSAHAAQDRTRERLQLEQDLAVLRAREAEAGAALDESRRMADAFLAETRHQLTERAAQARLRRSAAAEERDKAAQRARQMSLRAPVDGLVQQLATHTVGGVVTEAQALMVIVPDTDDPDGPVAEVQLRSLDIGHIRPGQSARVKFETFPYTRHGTIDARVEFVGGDAVAVEPGGTVFPVRLRLLADAIDVDGRRVRLTPGMQLTAEIHTGRRTMAEFLLSPLQRRQAEALRER